MDTNTQTSDATSRAARPVVLGIAWVAVLLVSALPLVLFTELTGSAPAWLRPGQVTVLTAGLVASLAIRMLRPLRLVFAVLVAVCAGEWIVSAAFAGVDLAGAAGTGIPPFAAAMLAVQVPRLVLALGVIAVCLVLFRGPRGFFLVPGDLGARAEPIRWLGVTRPTPWRRLAPIAALCLAGGVVVFIVIAGGAPLADLAAAVPLLPFVVLFAATNAFGEEVVYRAPQLAALERAVGPAQALLMTAAFFGIAHYYGVPYGIVGVAMSVVLGWVLGRSMIESRGMLWAWLIHVALDVVIFTFIAAGSVTPGG